jgi:malate dehydrogenase (oxaloacetate-decarboxylating)(NADP+)
LEIADNKELAYEYTSKGNLVGVISNGTAILGLGNRGPLASKPVMEGKGVLFKRFADIDVFDIEVDTTDVDKFVETVKAISPTFGGINLEDIKSPECFEIERRLIEECNIPVFHDDQHGTAIITTAALLNGCELTNRQPKDLKVVIQGSGAAGLSSARMFLAVGVKNENLIIIDSKGVIHSEREDLNLYKREFAIVTEKRNAEEALKGADLFMGLSVANSITTEMLLSMAPNPMVFALSNPDPEISYETAVATRSDIIMATGRSDYPNQINNVLGFPFIFRGALDVRATKISEKMKLSAAKALAQLAKEPVIEIVERSYKGQKFSFGADYIVPKPFDPRVIEYVATAVAQAACDENLAAKPISDWDGYRKSLAKRIEKYY